MTDQRDKNWKTQNCNHFQLILKLNKTLAFRSNKIKKVVRMKKDKNKSTANKRNGMIADFLISLILYFQ